MGISCGTLLSAGELPLLSGITASTIQSQGEMPLIAGVNEVAVVANANDVVTMPSGVDCVSRTVVILNNGANNLQIFPAVGNDLGSGLDTSVTLSSGTNASYMNYSITNWEQV